MNMETMKSWGKDYRLQKMGIHVDKIERGKDILTSFTTIPPNECATKNSGLSSASADILMSLRSERRLAACWNTVAVEVPENALSMSTS